MERSVVLVGQYGIPYNSVVQQIKQCFDVGCVCYADIENNPLTANGALRDDLAEGLFGLKTQHDIQCLVCAYTYCDVLVALDEANANVGVIYCTANLYWRYRQALSWGVLPDDFVRFEEVSTYQEIMKSRANAVLDFDKCVKSTSALELPNIDTLLDRTLAKLDIHSSIKRY